MDIVSFETATRLKNAGFPVPYDKHMKVWYAEKKFMGADGLAHTAIETVISAIGYMASIYYIPVSLVEDKFLHNDPAWSGLVYAPTATDIMRNLPSPTGVEFDGYAFLVTNGRITKIDDNPAEAAAMAYLELHENKQT